MTQLAHSPAPSSGVPTDADLLRTFLSRHDQACPMCDYSLRGLEREACPECGSKIVLQVRPAEPRMGWWTAGLIGLASGFGFFLVVMAIFVWAVTVDGGLGDLLEGWPIWLGLLVNGGLMWAWIRSSGRIRRGPRGRRMTLALACWAWSSVLTIGMLWLFVVSIF